MAKVHASEDRRIILCIEGLSTSFQMLDHLHSGMWEECQAIKSGSKPLDVVLLRCWSFVDVVHRIREISEAVPGLNSRTPELVRFVNETRVAEILRNYIQHLRGELMKTEPNKFPVWGSLAWVDENDSTLIHMVDSGTRVGDTTVAGVVYDTFARKFASMVTLTIENASFNFDIVYEECLTFQQFILPWMLSTYKLPVTMVREPQITSVYFRFASDHEPDCDDSANEKTPPA